MEAGIKRGEGAALAFKDLLAFAEGQNLILMPPALPEGEALAPALDRLLEASGGRAWMAGVTYRSQLKPGDTMAGWGLGEVVKSNAKGFAPGDLVSGEYGWQTHAVMSGKALTKHDAKHKPEHILGVLGITGLTAYFGMLDVGRPRPGETVLVSGAAGAVGTIAGQIAKIAGCRVIEGKVERGAGVRLVRDNVVIHEGKLKTLKRFKDEVSEVPMGQECGMAFENYEDIRAGDTI